MPNVKFQDHKTFGSGEEDFLSFYYRIWAWWQSWSCDLNRLYNRSLPIPMGATREILL